ncbi:MAG: hypothetical protein HUJ25_14080 [Crocinitomicaceae bacterium]|nr:hypothetical protein [Crocinitomicaceae bacterium]
MKQINFWDDSAKAIEVEHYTKAPSFELWLQCVFIPNARKAVQTGEFPKKSQVGLMAFRQYDYHSPVPEAKNLMTLLYKFDKAVNQLST